MFFSMDNSNWQRSGRTSVDHFEASSNAVAGMISNMYRRRVSNVTGRGHTRINATVTGNTYTRPSSAAPVFPVGSRNVLDDNVNRPVSVGNVNWPPRHNPFRKFPRSSEVNRKRHWKKENDPTLVGTNALPKKLIRSSQPVKRQISVSNRAVSRQRKFRKFTSGDVRSFGTSVNSFGSTKKEFGSPEQSRSVGELCAIVCLDSFRDCAVHLGGFILFLFLFHVYRYWCARRFA